MAGYDVYFGQMMFPIAPESISMKINGKNTVYELINEGEMNILKLAGLSTVSFKVLLPAVQYPFATYLSGFKAPSYYLNELERLKQSREPFQFVVGRHSSMRGRANLHDTNMTVSLEDYEIIENAEKNGFDIEVSINLKQYKDNKTKTFTVENASPTAPIVIAPVRAESTETPLPEKNTGGGKKKEKFKVQIPGMGVVEVSATSVQDAITAAGGGTWTGTIYVNGKTYKVTKGKLDSAVKIGVDAVGKKVSDAKSALTKAVQTITEAAKITEETTSTTSKTTADLKKIANKNVTVKQNLKNQMILKN